MVSNRSNGIYRSVIAAIAGLALIGAAPSKEEVAEGKQAAAEHDRQSQLQRIATALEIFPHDETKDSGCQPGQDKRESDLCAQWKAADAAADSAIWTARMFWAGLFGLLIGGFTLFFAGRAAHWAKQAAFETKRSADTADENLNAFFAAEKPSLVVAINDVENFEEPNSVKCKKVELELTNLGNGDCVLTSLMWGFSETENDFMMIGPVRTERIKGREVVLLGFVKSRLPIEALEYLNVRIGYESAFDKIGSVHKKWKIQDGIAIEIKAT